MVRAMVGGCCVCLDDRGWDENPLVYCDGHGCSVAVHQACYGIVKVPHGPWFCCKCQSTERVARVKCELCPLKDGALKRTDSGGWAHVVCALYIPEVKFGNVATMQPIILSSVPHERYAKTCYICEEHGRESKTASGACMACNKPGCRHAFHVTCAQSKRLLCEEGGNNGNVQYVGYCQFHWGKKNKPGVEDQKSEQGKEKDKKQRVRQDSISSTSSDQNNTGHPLDQAAAIIKRGKKAITPGKLTSDNSSKIEESGPTPWQLHTSPAQDSPQLAKNVMLPAAMALQDVAASSLVGNGMPQHNSPYYPVSHSHFTMDDLLKNNPTSALSRSLPNGTATAGSSADDFIPSHTSKGIAPSGSGTKKRRVMPAKAADGQKSKKPKTVNTNQSTKGNQVKKVKKKALKLQQNAGGSLHPSTASGSKESMCNNIESNSFIKPSMWNLLENGDTTSNMAANGKIVPESFQELLEFQWNEGTQFLMQRALNFDVASLLTCLHQLKSDNSQLESRLNELLRRRDRLLATNARLAQPLGCEQAAASMQQQYNPLSALLSQLRNDTTTNQFTSLLPTKSVGSPTVMASTSKNAKSNNPVGETPMKPEKKAPRPKQSTKKSEKSSPNSKKSAKSKAPISVPVTSGNDSKIDIKQNVPSMSPAMERLMQPLLPQHRSEEHRPPSLPVISASSVTPKRPQEQSPAQFIIQSSSNVGPPGQLLPGNQHHSPSTYGSTQAALPQASGAMGFLVSQLQNPFSIPRIICGGDAVNSSTGKLELPRKQNNPSSARVISSPSTPPDKIKATTPVQDK